VKVQQSTATVAGRGTGGGGSKIRGKKAPHGPQAQTQEPGARHSFRGDEERQRHKKKSRWLGTRASTHNQIGCVTRHGHETKETRERSSESRGDGKRTGGEQCQYLDSREGKGRTGGGGV